MLHVPLENDDPLFITFSATKFQSFSRFSIRRRTEKPAFTRTEQLDREFSSLFFQFCATALRRTKSWSVGVRTSAATEKKTNVVHPGHARASSSRRHTRTHSCIDHSTDSTRWNDVHVWVHWVHVHTQAHGLNDRHEKRKRRKGTCSRYTWKSRKEVNKISDAENLVRFAWALPVIVFSVFYILRNLTFSPWMKSKSPNLIKCFVDNSKAFSDEIESLLTLYKLIACWKMLVRNMIK